MSLTRYKEKRNFSNTPEPKEGKGGNKDSLSFVVQRHDASHLHYDLRLEMDGVLKSWAVPKGPSMVAGEKRLAVFVEDHPLPYGKFYGEIPKGNYGAGIVDIWDEGTYEPPEPLNRNDAEKLFLEQLKKGDIKFTIHGTHLKGTFALVRMHDESGKNWLLIKKKDEFDLDKYAIDKIDSLHFGNEKNADKWVPGKPAGNAEKQASPTKDVKEKTIEQAWKSAGKPMLAKLAVSIQDNPDWIYETKYDGYRAVTKISKGTVEMVSRNGNSFNKQYNCIVKELEALTDEVILDGEIVIEDEHGVSNFQLLQNFTTTKKGILKYYVFDILYVNGFLVSDLPLRERKELLGSFFSNNHFENIFETEFVKEKGEKLFADLSARGFEGIIAKDLEGLYFSGKRSGTWLKVKTVMMQEAVIAGYTQPQNSRKHFGSIILGIYNRNKLEYIGNCGTGFSDASLKELSTDFQKLETKTCPFQEKPDMTGMKGKPTWLNPELVCNVKFLEWTNDHHLRNPVFMGLREDKEAEEVEEEAPESDSDEPKEDNVKEKVTTFDNKVVKCTNLTKVYWPEEGIMKGQMIDYYQRISKWMLPYLQNRPQSLNRHPNGITGQSFYHKDMDINQVPSWLKTVKMHSKSNDADIDYLVCNDVSTLIYMANLGCIEINPWHSVYTKPDNPDYMILDLDPGEIDFTSVVDTALVIKELCDELSISSFCKTSGATGLHIYIPMGAQYSYDQVKIFAELMANITHQRIPKVTSVERSISKRKDKIYVDFLQNRKGQTIAAPYSIRPKPHATVSTPLEWKEVNHNLSPQQFHIGNTEQRLEKTGDLWKGVLGKGIALTTVLAKIEKL